MSKCKRIVGFSAPLCGAFGLLFVFGCATSSTTSSAAGGKLAITVSLHGWHYLSAELKNVSNSPIKLAASNLPWEWRYSMWVKAFEDDASGSPLDERFIPADPPINKMIETLSPGNPIHGQIDLTTRFPDLEEVLMRRGVVLFWSYVPDLEDSESQTRLSGSLVIPKFR